MPLNYCIPGIADDITSTCDTQTDGGIEQRVWLFHRGDHTITTKTGFPNIIENITNLATKKSYKLLGFKNLLNAGNEAVISEDRADRFKHMLNFQQFEFASADIINVDNLNDVFAVVERKDKAADGDGTFFAIGLKNGLWKTAATRMSNDINGARSVEMASMDTGLEPYSEYTVMAVPSEGQSVYAATLAMLTATETAGV